MAETALASPFSNYPPYPAALPLESQNTAEMKRLQAVRLYGSGRPVSDIVDVTGCVESSLRRWVGHYKERGIAGLQTNYQGRAQNASKLTEAQRADLNERLRQYRPDQLLPSEIRISTGKFWAVSDLEIVVEQWYGVSYQDRGSYRNLLHRCGFSYQRAERVYKSRPSEADIAEFEAQLEKK